jgi:hypothetical protein
MKTPVVTQFGPWAGDLLGALCESFALFAAKGLVYRKVREEVPLRSQSLKRCYLFNCAVPQLFNRYRT